MLDQDWLDEWTILKNPREYRKKILDNHSVYDENELNSGKRMDQYHTILTGSELGR